MFATPFTAWLAIRVKSGPPVEKAGVGAAAGDPAVLDMNLDLIARESRQLRREHELIRGLVQIDRRRPAGSVSTDEMTELFVQREEITERIPAGKRHVLHRSMVARGRAICATIARIYRH